MDKECKACKQQDICILASQVDISDFIQINKEECIKENKK